MFNKILLLLLLLNFKAILCLNNKNFPDGFLFGVASSAYQIEGGHDATGKGESIWDYYLRVNPDLVEDSTNGNVACDSYNKYEEDLAILGELGVDFYRFSISWSRLMPHGRPNQINPDGLRYYNALIDGLVARNIKPMITLYHWDLPKTLQDFGGWTNPILADYFEDYARVVFENFGDRVKFWITFNTNWFGYGDAQWPPLLNQSGIGEYLYVKNVLLAHGKVYRLYQEQYKKSQNGQIGITFDAKWWEAGSESIQDQEAAERARQFMTGLYANPIFGDGDFPEIVKNRIDQLSQNEGFFKSRLPKLTQEEKNVIKGSYDFMGLNIYTTFLVKDAGEKQNGPSFYNDINVQIYQSPEWKGSNSVWLKVVPDSIPKSLKWIKETYGNPPIIITENGFSDKGEIHDVDRIEYFKLHLEALLGAIHEDGVRVLGYAAWSLLDNFEWTSGHKEKFGLYHVDFNDPNRKRTQKSSAKWYKNLIKQRTLDGIEIKTEL